MIVARSPSTVTMPAADPPYPSIHAFLQARFPQVSGATWQQRLDQGKLLDDAGLPITRQTAYAPHRKIHYFREREQEPQIPFTETILFHNDEILVACKPHFLPVIPGGPYINECLLNRLQQKTGNPELVPINRIDRETAGLVLFSARKENRDLYCELFRRGAVDKTYLALGHYPAPHTEEHWLVENRIEAGVPWFRMAASTGACNSRSRIRLLEVLGPNRTGMGEGCASLAAGDRLPADSARFHLTPLTGKKHQLRLHMSGLGLGIINDRYYPDLTPEQADDFEQPLQLLAHSLAFQDPITGKRMEFRSERKLLC